MSPPAAHTALTCPAPSARTSALREFLAQATGSLAGTGIRQALRSAGTAGSLAGAAWMGAGLAAAGWRACSLSERALAGAPGRAPWACRLALAALPLVAASAVTLAMGAAQAPDAVLLFAGGLLERAVRDLTSHGLAAWMPRPEMAHPEGGGVGAAIKVHIEWARAIQAMPRTFACTAIQAALTFTLAPSLGESLAARATAQAASSGLLEAARAVINHEATGQQARLHGLVLRPQTGQGVAHALGRAADVCSLRETLALPAEILDMLVGTPGSAGGQAAMALALGTLKGLGEARSALVNLGREAESHAQHAQHVEHAQLMELLQLAQATPGQSAPSTLQAPSQPLESPLEAAASDLSPVPPPA